MITHRMGGTGRHCIIPAAAALLIFLMGSATGQLSLGLSPAELVFGSLYVDGYGRQELVVSSASEGALTVRLSFIGDAGGWLRAVPSEVEVARGMPAAVAIVAEPEDASPGSYTLMLVASVSAAGGATPGQEGALSVVEQRYSIPVRLLISGEARPACAVAASIGQTEEGHEMPLLVRVMNTGNVALSPAAEAAILSGDEETLSTHSFSLARLRPGEEALSREAVPHGLQAGTYWVFLSVPECGSFTVLPLAVAEERPLAAEMDSFSAAERVSSRDIVPLTVAVRNPHGRVVESAAVVEVLAEDGTPMELRSERVRLSPGEEQVLTLYIRDLSPGTYTLRARVEGYTALGQAIPSGVIVERTATVSGPVGGRSLRIALLLGMFAAAAIVQVRLIRIERAKRKGRHERRGAGPRRRR